MYYPLNTSSFEELNATCTKICFYNVTDYSACPESVFVDCAMFPGQILESEYLIPVTVLLFIIFLSGLLGNLSVCTVIVRHPVLRSETNMYLFSLAISDLLLLVFGLPSELWHYWQMHPYAFGDFMCRFNAFFASTGTWASVLTVVSFSIERYNAICHPLRTRSWSGKRVPIVILAIWTLSIATALPLLHVYHVRPMVTYEATNESSRLSVRCFRPRDKEYAYYGYLYIITTVVFFFIPMIVLALVYTKIALFIRSNRKLSRNCGIQNSCAENRNTFNVLAAAVLAFFISGLPYHYQRMTTAIISDDENDYIPTQEEKARDRLVMVVTAIFYYMSSTINPILYNAMSKRYRKAFMEIIWKRSDEKSQQFLTKDNQSSSKKSTSTTVMNFVSNVIS